MKLFIAAICFLHVSSAMARVPDSACYSLLSRAGRVVIIDPEPELIPIPARSNLPTEVTSTGTVITKVSNTANIISGTNIGPGVRTLALQELLACEISTNYTDSLSWSDSPTQLAVGNSDLQYQLGAVLGNWALLGATAIGWGALSFKYGSDNLRFPGGLTLPVLFLTAPTASAAMTLLQEGTLGQQVLGGLSFTAQLIGTGLVAVILHPYHFGARWDASKATDWTSGAWGDALGREGYTKRQGILFRDYRSGMHWFMTVELLMSMASGVLSSYQSTGGDCKKLLAGNMGTQISYALAQVLLNPNRNRGESIFYGCIAVLQALAVTTPVVSWWAGASEETQKKVDTAAQWTVSVTQWALMAKSIYDLGKRIRSVYRNFFTRPSAALKVTNLNDMMGNDDGEELVLMDPEPVVPEREETPQEIPTPMSSESINSDLDLPIQERTESPAIDHDKILREAYYRSQFDDEL